MIDDCTTEYFPAIETPEQAQFLGYLSQSDPQPYLLGNPLLDPRLLEERFQPDYSSLGERTVQKQTLQAMKAHLCRHCSDMQALHVMAGFAFQHFPHDLAALPCNLNSIMAVGRLGSNGLMGTAFGSLDLNPSARQNLPPLLGMNMNAPAQDFMAPYRANPRKPLVDESLNCPRPYRPSKPTKVPLARSLASTKDSFSENQTKARDSDIGTTSANQSRLQPWTGDSIMCHWAHMVAHRKPYVVAI